MGRAVGQDLPDNPSARMKPALILASTVVLTMLAVNIVRGFATGDFNW
jgi:hypothetical protein